MRTVSATALAKAQAFDGVESMVVVELDTGSGLLYLGDRELGGVEDRIKSLGNVNISINEKGATAGSVSVELDDSDQYFLDLLCSIRFEGRTARILQVFDGDVTDAVELLVGKVGSPVVWEEEDRCFRFDIVAFYQSADNEVPYAPEEDTSDLDEAAWNKPWPRIYGLPIDVPAVQVIFPPVGNLTRELQPPDDYFEIEVKDGVEFPLGTTVTVQVGNEWMTGQFEEIDDDPVVILRFNIQSRNVSKGTVYSQDRAVLSQIEEPPEGWGESWELDPRYAAWDADGLLLAGNWLLLIDAPTEIGSGQVNVVGFPSNHIYGQFLVPSFVGNKNYILYQKGNATRGQLPWFGPGGLMFISIGAKADIRGVLDVNDTLWPAGTEVQLVEAVKYVVSDLPADAVYRVRAWREVKLDERGGSVRQLVNLAEDFYTVHLNDTVDGRSCSTIELPQTLGSRNSGWDDDLFVTVKRGTGNVADIITELLEDAGLTVDTGTVEEDCEAYPMNFAVLDRKDSLELAYDIAWQGRCGLSVLGSVAVLKYLSVKPTTHIFAYSNDTTLEGILQLTTTELSEVINDLWVTWQKRGSQTEPEKLHYKNADSITAYGRRKEELNVYVYRHKRLVQKTAQFWFNRWSRVWRKIRTITDLDAIAVTAYDDVRSLLPELETIAMVEDIEHDTEMDQISAMLWTPVEVGTCELSDSAYLSDVGDTAPGIPSFTDPGDVAEVIEVSPLDLSLSEPEVRVGEALDDEVAAGPIYGVFNAKLYKSNENTGDVVEQTVQVKNLAAGQPVRTGQVVTVFKAEDGTYYSAPSSGSSVLFGVVTSVSPFTCDLFEIVEGSSNLLSEDTEVVKMGSGTPVVGDDILVFQATDGTYWAKPGTETPPIGLAKVTSDTADKNNVPALLYQTADFSGSGTSISVKLPALQTTAKVPANTWMIVMRFGDAWVGYLPLIRNRVPV